jgi:hypothetical protein
MYNCVNLTVLANAKSPPASGVPVLLSEVPRWLAQNWVMNFQASGAFQLSA